MKRRGSWLYNNNFVRLLSVVMGIALWVIVNSSSLSSSSGLNTSQTIRNVPVEVLTAPHMLAVQIQPRRVNINIYGTLIDVTLAQAQASGIRAIANAVNLGPGVHHIPLAVEGGTAAVSYAPQTTTASVYIEQKVTASFRPQVTVVGDPAAGLVSAKPILSARRILVTGPDKAVHQVRGVEVHIDVSGSNNSVSRIVPVIPVGADGRIISGVSCSPSTETVTIPIHNPVQPYNLVATTTGAPKGGLVVGSISISPAQVGVSGSTATLTQRPSIVLPPVDVTGWTSNRTVQVPIPIPFPGGRLTTPYAQVTVTLVPGAVMSLSGLPVNLVGQRPGVSYRIVGAPTVDILLQGPATLVQNLTVGDAQPYVDVSALTPGQKLSLPVGVALPANSVLKSVTPGYLTVVASRMP